MNIAPTCPKCLKPYWNDGSQTAVQICKCVDETLPPPSLIVNSDMRILNLLEEINKKLDKIVSIPMDAEVKVNFANIKEIYDKHDIPMDADAEGLQPLYYSSQLLREFIGELNAYFEKCT